MKLLRPGASFAALVVAAGLVMSGCGPDGSSGGSPSPPSAEPPVLIDEGCSVDHPNRVHPTPPETGVLVTICASDDGTSVQLANVSEVVLDVSFPRMVDPPTASVEPDSSFEAQTVDAAVGSGCDVTPACRIAPGRTLDADATQPIALEFEPDGMATARAKAALVVSELITKAITSPGQQLVNSAATCAQDATKLSSQSEYLDDELRHAFDSYLSCKNLLAALHEGPAEEAAAGDHAAALVKRLTPWESELELAVARVLAHR